MSNSYTDSSIIEHHEDGSWTETTVVTHQPVTKAQKATAYGVLGAIVFAPFAPLVGIIVAEKIQDRRERRKAEKLSKTEDEN